MPNIRSLLRSLLALTPQSLRAALLLTCVVDVSFTLYALADIFTPQQSPVLLGLNPLLLGSVEFLGEHLAPAFDALGLSIPPGLVALALLVGLSIAMLSVLLDTRRYLRPWRAGVLWSAQIGLASVLDVGFIVPQLSALAIGLRLPLRAALPAFGAEVTLIEAWNWSAFAQINPTRPYCPTPGAEPIPLDIQRWLGMGGSVVFLLFLFVCGRLLRQAMCRRREWEQLQAQRQHTQTRLSNRVRQSEQHRVAWRLHRAMDLHLSAIHRELAQAQLSCHPLPCGPRQAMDTVSTLLHSVEHEVQRVIRNEAFTTPNVMDLHRALETLCRNIPQPQIQLHYEVAAPIDHPGVAHAVFRCVQETVSNTVRYARARHMTVRLVEAAQGWLLTVTDDGQGLPRHPPRSGTGLPGLRRRVEALGGWMQTFSDAEHPGLGLKFWLPHQAATLA